MSPAALETHTADTDEVATAARRGSRLQALRQSLTV
jgi:hypothetical protein